MQIIHYELIGSHPEVERLRETLDVVLSSFSRGIKIDEDVIVKCAAHFYGLRLEDFDDVKQLADAVLGMDQELELS